MLVVAAVEAALDQASSGFGQRRLPIRLKIPKTSCLSFECLFETIAVLDSVSIYSEIKIEPYRPKQ